MLDESLKNLMTPTTRVSDLKQWVYCPRVFYYQYHLPAIRPTTYKMEAGSEAGKAEEGREERRSLRAYGLAAGEREFNVALYSASLGLRGAADLVITADSGEVIPVDYKLSAKIETSMKLQLAAYALLLEELRGCQITRGFVYLIPKRRAEEVFIDTRLRQKLQAALMGLQWVVASEGMPAPTSQIAKCVTCEFRRFCNDVL
jgi:CRISPR-associated exonuclease Cas4